MHDATLSIKKHLAIWMAENNIWKFNSCHVNTLIIKEEKSSWFGVSSKQSLDFFFLL